MDEKTDTECEPSPLPIPLNSKSETIGVQVQQKLESKEVPIHLVPKEIPTRSIIKRRGFGSKGQCIPLLANHFKVNVNFPDAIFYQYTVSVSTGDGKSFASKIGGRKLLDRVYHTYSSELANKRFAYDGEKTLYTVGPLPQNNLEFTVVLEETVADGSMEIDGESLTASNKRRKHSFSSRTFKVSLSYAAKIPLKSIVLAHKGVEVDNGAYDALRVLDTILRQQAANRGCLLVRQSFFRDDSRNFTDVGGGVTSVRGFHSSFRTTRGGLSLNMDVSTTMILTPGPVIDFLKTNQNVNDFHQIDWVKAKKMLKNLRIRPKHRNVEYKIIGLTEKICTQLFFPLKVKSGDNEEHLEISVFDYFTKHLGLQLSYSAYLPCIDVGKPKRPIYLPVELCSLVSLQRYTKDLSSVQRASLVEKSRLKPLERINSVTNALKSYRYEEDPLLSACGLSMEKELIEFEGRVLETPKLKVGNNEDCIARNGRWNFSNKTVQNPTRVDAWAIVNFSARGDTSLISRELINTGRRKGIHMERPHTLIEEDPLFRNSNALARVERMIEKMKDKLPAPPQLILCVLPQKKNCDIYGPWKKKCLSELGIVTQCISPSPSKLTDQYLTNVLLKINSKLGGVNSLLEFEQSKLMPLIMNIPTMIMGMDVSHGSPGQSGMPSIAAVVGSRCWPYISRYRASVRTQSPKVEMIDTLFKPSANDDDDDDGIVRELLLDFYESSNQRKPKQIIVFRDGVSESQFNQVLDIELDQIIKAYQHLGEVDIPKFTVIVAQKNHHTKLFRTKGSENVPPGTVVDQTIVHPRNYDFYMCAHAGMMGTSKPAHYHVLLDEIGFSPDDLQKLIHSLSYVNQRTTTATSIVAPICYAHLAAKQMSHFLKLDDLSDTSSVQDSMTSSGSPCIPELPRLHEAVAGSMFFC